jgi:hypothetical protein
MPHHCEDCLEVSPFTRSIDVTWWYNEGGKRAVPVIASLSQCLVRLDVVEDLHHAS